MESGKRVSKFRKYLLRSGKITLALKMRAANCSETLAPSYKIHVFLTQRAVILTPIAINQRNSRYITLVVDFVRDLYYSQ
jgi:hypothetical protein